MLTELVEGEAMIDVDGLAEAIVKRMNPTAVEPAAVEPSNADLEAEQLALELDLIDD